MCIAPTGVAAVLISGSTYYSILDINKFNCKDSNALLIACDNLQNVDYIFVDEISILDCLSIYNISERMCKALEKPDEAFGGINIIFAGDFAQLPPAVGGLPLYDGRVQPLIHQTHTINEQKAIIGKAIWRQFTTAVILRQNMRQKSQTPNDAKLRTALENM